jgi:hypothetical protein
MFGKQEPISAMPLEEYNPTTGTHQFAFEKAIEAEQLAMFIMDAMDVI